MSAKDQIYGFMDPMAIEQNERAKACGDKPKVFDWDKAARLIKEKRPLIAEAGLAGDWSYTGGVIWDTKPNLTEYTYLSSNWAIPTLVIEGEEIECFVEDERWDAHTKWPQSALDIVGYAAKGTFDETQ